KRRACPQAGSTRRYLEGARRSGGTGGGPQSEIRHSSRKLLGAQPARGRGDGFSADHVGAATRAARTLKMADSWPLHFDANAPNDPVFVGVGELPSGRYPERNFIGDLTHVGLLALADARMVPRDVDTILLIPCLHSPFDQADLIFSRMAEELGLLGHLKSSFMVHSGGSTSDNAVRLASGLIGSGHARTVLVLHCERWGSADLNAMVTMLSKYGIPNEWELPTGLQFNAIGALITRRYMHASRSSPSDMAAMCVALRQWAQLHPNAMYRAKSLTVEQILASRMIADPLHAMECPMLADGAAAFVMTGA